MFMTKKLYISLGGINLGFDWGSFSGGVIGTVGAFLAAKYTMKKQEEKDQPKIDKSRYLIASKLLGKIDAVGWRLVNNLDKTTGDLMNIVIAFLFELEDIIPDAIEVDRSFVKIIEDIKLELSVFNKELWPKLTQEQKTMAEYTMHTNAILFKHSENIKVIISKIKKIN